MEKVKQKKKFQMPHLLWLMILFILLASLMTYVIPAGSFDTDENGLIIGGSFHYLQEQTPVDPLSAILLLFESLINAAPTIFVVMLMGAGVGMSISSGALDDLINWAIYKLQDKGKGILVSVVFCLMVYLGGFGGTDALIAVVPLGIILATKLNLDAICALGVTFFATMIGFGTGPCKNVLTQTLMGVTPYHAFFSRFLIMNLYMVVGLVMIMRYIKKLEKDPRISPMYEEGWRPGEAIGDGSVSKDTQLMNEVQLKWQSVVSVVLFFGQFVLMAIYPFVWGTASLYSVMSVLTLAVGIVNQLLCGKSMNGAANELSKGFAGMAFVGFVIGLAGVLSAVLKQGNIMHTIVYGITLPLGKLPTSLSAVGMVIAIAIINPILPSATSKAALLVPII